MASQTPARRGWGTGRKHPEVILILLNYIASYFCNRYAFFVIFLLFALYRNLVFSIGISLCQVETRSRNISVNVSLTQGGSSSHDYEPDLSNSN